VSCHLPSSGGWEYEKRYDSREAAEELARAMADDDVRECPAAAAYHLSTRCLYCLRTESEVREAHYETFSAFRGADEVSTDAEALLRAVGRAGGASAWAPFRWTGTAEGALRFEALSLSACAADCLKDREVEGLLCTRCSGCTCYGDDDPADLCERCQADEVKP
jgi:hypothetical protein